MSAGEAKRVGLIGDPVEHSLSPAFQQPAFDHIGLSIRYELWHTPAERIAERLAFLRSGEVLGANVTVPHKQAFFSAVDSVSDAARRAGAVNTIIVRDGHLHGENTDIHGFIVPLQERAFPFAASKAVVIGAGGAARGVLVALLDAGIAELIILNRTTQRANELATQMDDHRVRAMPASAWRNAADGAALLVNATSLGWSDTTPVIDPAAFSLLAPNAIAYDLTYRTTHFLRAAAASGVAALDGLDMLVHQGARSFELWTGRPAPIELMLAAGRAARAARET